MISQKEHEKQHQVNDGITECLHRQTFVFATEHTQDIPEKSNVQHGHTGQIQEAAHSGQERQDGHDDQQDGVEQYVPAGELYAVSHR